MNNGGKIAGGLGTKIMKLAIIILLVLFLIILLFQIIVMMFITTALCSMIMGFAHFVKMCEAPQAKYDAVLEEEYLYFGERMAQIREDMQGGEYTDENGNVVNLTKMKEITLSVSKKDKDGATYKEYEGTVLVKALASVDDFTLENWKNKLDDATIEKLFGIKVEDAKKGGGGNSGITGSGGPPTASGKAYVEEIKEAAMKAACGSEQFTSILMAQLILESNWGKSELAYKYNNYFGIKAAPGQKSVMRETKEQTANGTEYTIKAPFRVFDTMEEGMKANADKITNGLKNSPNYFKKAWISVAGSPENAAKALTGTYATDTQYASKLMNIINTYDLKQYDKCEGVAIKENNQIKRAKEVIHSDKLVAENATEPSKEKDATGGNKEKENNKNNDTDISKLLKDKIIFIDPGHGGKDAGALSKDSSYPEKKFNLDMAMLLKGKLEEMGAKVVLSREGDTYPELSKRPADAIKANADLFLSIHANSTTSNTTQGTETLYKEGKDKAFATNLQRYMLAAWGLKDRGVVARNELAVLRGMSGTDIPAALIEPAFINNVADFEKLFRSDESLNKLASALSGGILETFGIEVTDEIKELIGDIPAGVASSGGDTADESASGNQRKYNNFLTAWFMARVMQQKYEERLAYLNLEAYKDEGKERKIEPESIKEFREFQKEENKKMGEEYKYIEKVKEQFYKKFYKGEMSVDDMKKIKKDDEIFKKYPEINKEEIDTVKRQIKKEMKEDWGKEDTDFKDIFDDMIMSRAEKLDFDRRDWMLTVQSETYTCFFIGDKDGFWRSLGEVVTFGFKDLKRTPCKNLDKIYEETFAQSIKFVPDNFQGMVGKTEKQETTRFYCEDEEEDTKKKEIEEHNENIRLEAVKKVAEIEGSSEKESSVYYSTIDGIKSYVYDSKKFTEKEEEAVRNILEGVKEYERESVTKKEKCKNPDKAEEVTEKEEVLSYPEAGDLLGMFAMFTLYEKGVSVGKDDDDYTRHLEKTIMQDMYEQDYYVKTLEELGVCSDGGASDGDSSSTAAKFDGLPTGNQGLSKEAKAYMPMVEEYTEKYGMSDYKYLVMAMLMQESGGKIGDVMQSSQSANKAKNSLGPEASINQGVKYLKYLVNLAKKKGVEDINVVIQAYNFGESFIGHAVQANDKKYGEAAINLYKSKHPTWGDRDYVSHVARYATFDGNSNESEEDNKEEDKKNKLVAELIAENTATDKSKEKTKDDNGENKNDNGENRGDEASGDAGVEDEENKDENKEEEKDKVLSSKPTVCMGGGSSSGGGGDYGNGTGIGDVPIGEYIDGKNYKPEDIAVDFSQAAIGEERFRKIYNEITKYWNTPYTWGGTSAGAFDCSGLVLWGYQRTAGASLPRTSAQQFKATEPIGELKNAKPGDLLFFSSTMSANNITHVAIYLGNNVMYHAAGKAVKYSNPTDSYWHPRYIGAGRVKF